MDKSYNWDDLEVGRYDLNHSERFFSRKHDKHERIPSDMFEAAEDKENLHGNCTEICKNAADSTSDAGKKIQKVLQKSNSVRKQLKEPVSSSLKTFKSENNLRARISNQKINLNGLKEAKEKLQNIGTTKEPCKDVAASANTQMKRTVAIGPSVYKYGAIYKKHKDQMIQKKIEDERKQKQFHSKPAPNFSAIHKKKQDSHGPLHVTEPQTPLVYKRSREMQEKKKKLLEEIKKKQEQPKFTCRPPRVLVEEPFKPKKPGRKVDPEPFDLHMEKRLHDRKQFNENLKKIMEQKKRQEEEKKKRDEEEMVRKFRKATTFKAQPNPFR